MSLLSIVVNYKTDDLLEKFLISYDKYVDEIGRKLIIVDVESDDPDKQFNDRWLPYKHIWRTHEENIGYARAVNEAIASEDGHAMYYVNLGIFNADTEFVDEGAVDSCLDLLDSNDDIAVVGPLQYDSRGRITHAGIFGTNEKPMHRAWLSKDKNSHRYIEDCISVSGSAYFTKRSVWDEMTQCGLYQQAAPGATGAFLPTPHYYEETYCSYHMREHGYRVLYNGKAEMIHEWHKASAIDGPIDNQILPVSREIFRDACRIHNIKAD